MWGCTRARIVRSVLFTAIFVAATTLALESPASADPDPDAEAETETSRSRTEALAEALTITPPGHVEPLRYVMLLSLDGFVGPNRATDNDAGFDLSDARLAFGGELEGGFGYFVQANLIQSRPLLDLIIDWKSKPHGFRLSGGYFRTPFSAELLIPAPRLDFIERSQIVRALAPSRHVGVQIDQEVFGDALVARAGVFNGNGLDTNDDERFLYILRFDGRVHCGDDGEGGSTSVFEYGVNGGYSEDDDADLGFNLPKNFAGKRWLAGADARWTSGPIFVSAEGLYASIEPNGASRRDVYGYQASLGWTVNDLIQLLVRYDGLYAASFQEDRDLAIGSIVFNFTQIIALQLELRVPTRGEAPSPGGAGSLTVTF